MAESTPPSARPPSSLKIPPATHDDHSTPLGVDLSPPKVDKMLCDRCGDKMYRVHAVWRCPACGFKTDCCGW